MNRDPRTTVAGIVGLVGAIASVVSHLAGLPQWVSVVAVCLVTAAHSVGLVLAADGAPPEGSRR